MRHRCAPDLVVVAITVLLAVLVAAGTARAKPQVMILGTYHMHNPKRDVVKSEMRDTLSRQRQAEILEVVASLEKFRPTRIAVEADPRTTKVNGELAAYLAGTRELNASETEQIGFRLAKRLGHTELCPFDQPGPYHWMEVRDWQKKRGVDVDAGVARRKQRTEEEDRPFTVGQRLALANSDESLRRAHWGELQHVDAGDPADGPGPRLAAEWYERNLRMFARLRACPRNEDERLLVIVGAGHAKLLREFVRDSPDLAEVSPLSFLPPVPAVTRDPLTSIRVYPPSSTAQGR